VNRQPARLALTREPGNLAELGLIPSRMVAFADALVQRGVIARTQRPTPGV
jgi:hypothetical protein